MNVNLESKHSIDTELSFINKDDLSNLFLNDIKNNTSYLISEKDIIISDLDKKAIKFSYLPTLGLSGSYGWNESINDNPYAFYNKSISDGFSAGINIRWDIFRGGKKLLQIRMHQLIKKTLNLIKKK